MDVNRLRTSFRLEKDEKWKRIMLGESRVMRRWKSSLWKLIWRELLAYTLLFLFVSMIYRLALTESQQMTFEKVARWCGQVYTGLPLTFLLGFYVSLVVKRWWEQYCLLPWPDTIAFLLRGLVTEGEEQEENRRIRRTVVRYCLLSYVLCIRRLSARLRKRFPDTQEIVKTGLMRPDESEKIGSEDSWEIYGSNWWLPLKWNTEIVSQAFKKGNIKIAPGYNNLLNSIAAFRSSLTQVATYGHICVPLVYTQVVTLTVYFYFAVALIGEQWLIRREKNVKWWGAETCPVSPAGCHQVEYQGHELDLYYPIYMTVKFLFYFGWLKVAQTLYNPFGEDDEDFQLNDLIERHLKVALKIVEDDQQPPKLERDAFWNQPDPVLQDLTGDNGLTRQNTNPSIYQDDIKNSEEMLEFRTIQELRDPMA